MIFFLYGEDSYRSAQKSKELKEKFIKEVDKSGLNLTSLDGEKLDMEKLNQTISTSPFLADRRMIIIKNLISKNKDKNIQKEIVDLLKNLEKRSSSAKATADKKDDKDNIIIFWESGVGSKKKFGKPALAGVLTKYLFSLKDVHKQDFELLNVYNLEEWIRSEVVKRGGKTEREAVKYLAILVGNNLWQVSNEINKLLAYKKDEEILTDDIGLLVKGKFDDNIFNLIDALSNKNDKLTVKLLADQLDSGVSESYILSMLIRQFRIFLQIKELIEGNGGLSNFQVASELNIHSFTAQKALAQVRNFNLAELKRIYSQLLELDIQIKTGYTRPEVALDLFVAKVTD